MSKKTLSKRLLLGLAVTAIMAFAVTIAAMNPQTKEAAACHDYSITYHVGAYGTNHPSNPQIYRDGNNTDIEPAIAGAGMVFDGWYKSPLFFGFPVEKIEKTEKGNISLYAKWVPLEYVVTFNDQGGTGTNTTINVVQGLSMPTTGLTVPTRVGYKFSGYYSGQNGTGTQYYTSAPIASARTYNLAASATLYAKWTPITYTIRYYRLSSDTTYTNTTYTYNVTSYFGSGYGFTPPQTGQEFVEWNTKPDGSGTSYEPWESFLNLSSTQGAVINLYAQWQWRAWDVTVIVSHSNNMYQQYHDAFRVTYNVPKTYSIPNFSGYEMASWNINDGSTIIETGSSSTVVLTNKPPPGTHGGQLYIHIYYEEAQSSCVAEGTLITLADGSQEAVENLNGDELLLVWNHHTGAFDAAPIVFIHGDGIQDAYEIIQLSFSDNTDIKVIDEHAFWDFDLNRYVFIRENESAEYIGHWFNKQTTDINGELTWTMVQLVDVSIYTEITTAWSPVTFAHLNFYVNGLLSMPGDTQGLINIFEMDANTLQYDQTAFLDDITLYGTFEYADFAEMIPEEIFDAFQVQYLTVSLGKELISWVQIEMLIAQYADFFEVEQVKRGDNYLSAGLARMQEFVRLSKLERMK